MTKKCLVLNQIETDKVPAMKLSNLTSSSGDKTRHDQLLYRFLLTNHQPVVATTGETRD